MQGKGGKDRETLFPESIRQDLHRHLQWGLKLYLEDRKNNVPGVYLPYALQRKYPKAKADLGIIASERISTSIIVITDSHSMAHPGATLYFKDASLLIDFAKIEKQPLICENLRVSNIP